MTAPPPSRYRVVERGRRLVVIDRQSGAEVSRQPEVPGTDGALPRRGRLSLPSAPKRTSFDGTSTLTTHVIYDLKAPRTIRLDPGSALTLSRMRLAAAVVAVLTVVAIVAWPAVMVMPIVLANAKVRDGARRAATRWLDRVEAETN